MVFLDRKYIIYEKIFLIFLECLIEGKGAIVSGKLISRRLGIKRESPDLVRKRMFRKYKYLEKYVIYRRGRRGGHALLEELFPPDVPE